MPSLPKSPLALWLTCSKAKEILRKLSDSGKLSTVRLSRLKSFAQSLIVVITKDNVLLNSQCGSEEVPTIMLETEITKISISSLIVRTAFVKTDLRAIAAKSRPTLYLLSLSMTLALLL